MVRDIQNFIRVTWRDQARFLTFQVQKLEKRANGENIKSLTCSSWRHHDPDKLHENVERVRIENPCFV